MHITRKKRNDKKESAKKKPICCISCCIKRRKNYTMFAFFHSLSNYNYSQALRHHFVISSAVVQTTAMSGARKKQLSESLPAGNPHHPPHHQQRGAAATQHQTTSAYGHQTTAHQYQPSPPSHGIQSQWLTVQELMQMQQENRAVPHLISPVASVASIALGPEDSRLSTATTLRGTIDAAVQQQRRKDQLVRLNEGARVSGRWTIIKKLGSGAFGAVYLCEHIDGRQGALKTEPVGVDSCIDQEAKIMRMLGEYRGRGGEHFCRFFDEGRDVQVDTTTGQLATFNYIVMSKVGRGLDRLVSKAGGSFSPGTAIGASIQLLRALRALHAVGYLHLDIKPENAAIGPKETDERRMVFLLDFGLARRYISSTGQMRRQRSRAHFRGTPMYASISAHKRRDYSRRDDIESWFYVLVDLYTGSLPWTDVRGEHKTGEIKCRRRDNPPEVQQKAVLDLLQGCPPQFKLVLDHIDGLDFGDRPNYELIESILRTHLNERSIHEHPYDWEKEK